MGVVVIRRSGSSFVLGWHALGRCRAKYVVVCRLFAFVILKDVFGWIFLFLEARPRCVRARTPQISVAVLVVLKPFSSVEVVLEVRPPGRGM